MKNGTDTAETFSEPTLSHTKRLKRAESFGVWVRSCISRAGLKPADVARHVGIRREELHRALRGGRSFPADWIPPMPTAVRRYMLEDLAEGLHHGILPFPEKSESLTDFALLDWICTEYEELTKTMRKSMMDGVWEVTEVDECLERLSEVKQISAYLEGHLRELRQSRGRRVTFAQPEDDAEAAE